REARSRSRSPAARRESPRRRSESPRRMDTDDPAAATKSSSGGPKWAGVPDSRAHHGGAERAPFDPAKKAMNREIAAAEAAKRSKKECRVYVGNLSFQTKWNDLKDFMREGGSFLSRLGMGWCGCEVVGGWHCFSGLDVWRASRSGWVRVEWMVEMPAGSGGQKDLRTGRGVGVTGRVRDCALATGEFVVVVWLVEVGLDGRAGEVEREKWRARVRSTRTHLSLTRPSRTQDVSRPTRYFPRSQTPTISGKALRVDGMVRSRSKRCSGAGSRVWSGLNSAGTVVFAEIMMLPNGMSKGCGVVEFSTPDEAQKAIRELSDQTLLGRPLFIREDREETARYGADAVSGRAGYMGPGAFSGPPRGGFGGPRGAFGGGFGGHGGFQGHQAGQGRHLFVQGLPFTCGWQDLKDLFRAAGSIIRADCKINPDGTPSGTGTVVYETAQDAQNAIAMYNGFEFFGNILEVREDRFAPGGGGRGGFGGGFQPRGAFGRGGFGGFGGRGGFGGGFGHFGGAPDMGYGGADFSQMGMDPSAQFAGFPGAGRGGFGGGHFAPRGPYAGAAAAAPSVQILVKNLPWSTSNEDLQELFQTTGTVVDAEVLFENGRSRGSGIVQLATVEEAETAIAKFQSYSYGGELERMRNEEEEEEEGELL
ncbi:hypothetical protein P7C70_g5564, partial [Phenoliferia sp. Uapishka_3]